MSEIRRRSKGFRSYYAILIVFFIFMGLIMVFPMYNLLVTSFSTKQSILAAPLAFWPKEFTLSNFHYLVMDGSIFNAYGITIFTTLVGTALSMLVTLLLAYSLSKSDLPGGKLIHRILLATMFLDSGLIPFYMMVKNLGLTNTVWSSIIPGMVSLWNYLVIRSFFVQLPHELEEAAQIDGASYGRVFTTIVLPLSKPVIATFTLYYAVGYWNSWYNCMLFNNDASLSTLQLFVYRYVQQASQEYSEAANIYRQTYGTNVMNEEGIKAAACMAAVVPILCVYPFLQKYFTKGIMLGAIKG